MTYVPEKKNGEANTHGKRERERERETDRQTDRQTDRLGGVAH